MVMRLVNGAEFLHIPKTGGSWIQAVLRANNLIPKKHVGHKHADYDYNLLRPCPTTSRRIKNAVRSVPLRFSNMFGSSPKFKGDAVFRFCFVRNPLSWYESWWKYMQSRGWHDWGARNSKKYWHPNAILNGLGSPDFNQFVRNVVRERPGYVSELLFAYTKPGISFIGKTESLREDLAHVLDLLGVDYDRSTVEMSPRENISTTDRAAIRWDPSLKAMVTRLEMPALLHFDYLSEEEKSALGVEGAASTHRALRRGMQAAAESQQPLRRVAA